MSVALTQKSIDFTLLLTIQHNYKFEANEKDLFIHLIAKINKQVGDKINKYINKTSKKTITYP